jgi:N-methylhydantoinase A
VLLGDMGGTSFDTCLIRDNEIRIEKNVELGQLQTGLNLVDVVSIGAGGGSIVSVSERGVPQVGPRSASSTPGPACYGKGGTEATVTDAMLTLGLIDAGNYLGGRMALHPDKAKAALTEAIGDRFDWTPEEAAVAVHDLVVANMSNAIREVSVRKGHDPRDFVFLAYGGTLPMFAWQIAEAVGIDEVIVPEDSSVFCAEGLVGSDFALRRDQSLVWSLADLDSLDEVNATIDGIVETAIEEMEADGFKRDTLAISRYADLKFPGQVFELTVPVPERLTRDNVKELISNFHATYERTYGEGTAWAGSEPAMHLYTVAVNSSEPKPEAVGKKHVHADAEAKASEREIFLPSTKSFETVPVLPASQFAAGVEHVGPLIVDAVDTTLFVPPDVRITRDEFMSYRLSRKED